MILEASQENIQKLLEMLNHDYIQGILLYHKDKKYIPSKLIEEMQRVSKPVLYLNNGDFDSIVHTIEEMKKLKQIGLFRYVWEQSTRYWLTMINENHIQKVLERLSVIIDNPVVLLDPFFFVHSSIPSTTDISDRYTFLKPRYAQIRTSSQDDYTLLQEQQESFLLFKLENHGFLLIKQERGTITDMTIELVYQVLPSLLVWFKKEEAILQTNRKYANQFIYDVLYNNFESEEMLITQAKLWGWNFTKQPLLMVLQLRADNDQSLTMELLESIKHQITYILHSRSLPGIVTNFQDQVVIFVFDEMSQSKKGRKEFSKLLANQIHQVIAGKFPEVMNTIGLGRLYRSNLEIFRSFQEAKIALEMGRFLHQRKGVCLFEEIGVIRLLSLINNDVLITFFKETLGELLEYDHEHDGELVKTLEMYFQENGDISRTADFLYIHPNTLRNRLKKIESLLDISLNSYEDLLNIFVTIKISQLLK
ncbi:PucR family transcriptional regulator [Brevibacillus ginsengisoli]|uniref:PucR family transcriptional regulator n=1 Tax=Brevibacillus ginsengisoli TaxID=363854 RepID=UPI003CF1FC34